MLHNYCGMKLIFGSETMMCVILDGFLQLCN